MERKIRYCKAGRKMHRLRLLLIFAAALFLAGAETRLGEPLSAEASFPGSNGLIAFVLPVQAGPAFPYDIFVIDADGTGPGAAVSPLNLTNSSDASEFEPAWSADGSKVAFSRAVGFERPQLFTMNPDGTGVQHITEGQAPAWSPDGTELVFERRVQGPDPNDDEDLQMEIFKIPAGGGAETNLTNTLLVDEISPAWSPDGTKIAYVIAGDFPRSVYLMGTSGPPGPALAEGSAPDWSPDGTEIVAESFDANAQRAGLVAIEVTTGVIRPLTSEVSDVSPVWSPNGANIAFVRSVGASTDIWTIAADGLSPAVKVTTQTGGYRQLAWQPAPAPIVFIHGFLGSRIDCGANELWPNIHLAPPSGPDFPQMMLASDGLSTAAGACNVSVGDTLDEVLSGPAAMSIYQTTIDFLDGLAPGNVSYFNWDWRKSPEPSVALLDAFIDNIRTTHPNQKVVIVAHSYGGLLARWYVDDASRADKVERVVTIGTPAWGSPKALFPLYAGVETPDLSGLDLFMDNDDLHEFSKNLFGAYFLYPSASYGPWLTLHPASNPASRQDLLDYVTSLGGNAALLDQALTTHAGTLDSVPNGVGFEVIVGAGIPTISEIGITPDGYLLIDYSNGDGTVPAKSAARGQPGPTNPNAAHTHYACGVGHVDLPGDPQVTDAMRDYLLRGDPITLDASPCAVNGIQFRLFQLPPLASAAAAGVAPSGTAMTLEDAVLQGVVDYLDLPNEKFVITGTRFPEVVLPEGKFLEVTPLSDGTKGAPVIYGPLEGQITISASADGPAVMVDGEPAQLDGDVNCDRQVTALDALLLVLHAAGTPQSQPAACTTIGSGADPFGDIDCDNSITAEDGLAVLRIVAGVSLASLASCE